MGQRRGGAPRGNRVASLKFAVDTEVRSLQLLQVKPDSFDIDDTPVASDGWGTKIYIPGKDGGPVVVDFLAPNRAESEAITAQIIAWTSEWKTNQTRTDPKTGEQYEQPDKKDGKRYAVDYTQIPGGKKSALRNTGRAIVRVGTGTAFDTPAKLKNMFTDRRL